MQTINCTQGSDEWFAAKRGKITSSEFSKVLNKETGRGLYMRKLVAERLTGITQDGYHNDIMERGKEVEQQARIYYEELNGYKVKDVGFVAKDDYVGASPDGMVGDDGLAEIKCPNSTTHIDTLLRGKMPTGYTPQVQGQMWVCDRKWCDFISFDPRLKKRPFFCIRVYRDEKYIMVLSAAVEQFKKELQEIIKQIEGE